MFFFLLQIIDSATSISIRIPFICCLRDRAVCIHICLMVHADQRTEAAATQARWSQRSVLPSIRECWWRWREGAVGGYQGVIG